MILGVEITSKSKIIILVIAFLSLVFSGCTTFFLSQKNIEIRCHLSQAKRLSKQGKYELALKKNEIILNKYKKNPWKDKVLFNLGYLHAYYGNPQRNYEKSIIYFKRLVKEFPESSFHKQGNIWLAILNEIQLKEEEINRLKGEINCLKKENLEIQSAISIVTFLKDDKIEKLKKKISIQKIAINHLETQIKKIKKVDIQFDKKERKVKKKSSANYNSINKKQ